MIIEMEPRDGDYRYDDLHPINMDNSDTVRLLMAIDCVQCDLKSFQYPQCKMQHIVNMKFMAYPKITTDSAQDKSANNTITETTDSPVKIKYKKHNKGKCW